MAEHTALDNQQAEDIRAEPGTPRTLPADYGDPQAEYAAAVGQAVLCDPLERGLIAVIGRDRASWLHNLVTNTVKTLQPGEGNYVFATNARGRILFDGNVLILPDAIWVDIDRAVLPKALSHFQRYHIVEDIRLVDRTADFCRMSLLGPRAAEALAGLGATQGAAMAALGSTTVPLPGADASARMLVVRNDRVGLPGFDLFAEPRHADGLRRYLLGPPGPAAGRIGRTALEMLRIEAGIPAWGQDIDEETLPAETAQLDRAVSFVKGCYLGQEVVERMRSRGSLARRLVGLAFSGAGEPEAGDLLLLHGQPVGRLTSWCRSPRRAAITGLGYVKAAAAEPGTSLSVEHRPALQATIQPPAAGT
jgi:folate-binding protein YgfZ